MKLPLCHLFAKVSFVFGLMSSQSRGQPLSVDGGVAGVSVEDAADPEVRVTKLGVSQEERSNVSFKKSKLTRTSPNFSFICGSQLFAVGWLSCVCLPIIKAFVCQLPFSEGAQHGIAERVLK